MFDRTQEFFTRGQASQYLFDRYGVRQAVSSLAKLRADKGGPVFLKDGRAVIYRRADLDAWVASRLREVRQ